MDYFFCRSAPYAMSVVQNPRHRFGVADFSGAYPGFNFAQTKYPHFDFLVRLRLRFPQLQPCGQENHHVFANEAGGREQI